ncbi:MAG TPA: VOC family protein [Alphaproteobacteria bacterium]|jgi:catechol-2,3-dioxygenase
MAALESLNHTAICVHDLAEGMDFYCNILGGTAHQRSNYEIEDTSTGIAIFHSVILEDYLLALTVTANYMPMPPDGQLRGAHGFRHGFCVPRSRFEDVQQSLAKHDVQFEGPVDHPEKSPFGQSIYFKDPSGNFLEILWLKEEGSQTFKRRYIHVE